MPEPAPNGSEAVLLDQPLRLRYREEMKRWAKVKPGEVYRKFLNSQTRSSASITTLESRTNPTRVDSIRRQRFSIGRAQKVKAEDTAHPPAARPSAISLPLAGA